MIFDAVSRHNEKILGLKTFKTHMDRVRKAEKKHCEQEENGQSVVAFPEELPTIKEATKILVEEAMKRASGNQTLAAEMLGISRQALGKRLKNIDA